MSASKTSAPLVGIFVGGRGTRWGGLPKGNLPLESGEKLIARLARTVEAALPGATAVLVGSSAAYTELGLAELSDDPAGIGPLGGLRALLLHAAERGHGSALALACDLPHLGVGLVRRLAFEAPEADFLAPTEGTLWHTLVARYGTGALGAVDQCIAGGERALQRVVSRLGARAVELPVSSEEHAELHDWDTPEDMQLSKGYRAPNPRDR